MGAQTPNYCNHTQKRNFINSKNRVLHGAVVLARQ